MSFDPGNSIAVRPDEGALVSGMDMIHKVDAGRPAGGLVIMAGRIAPGGLIPPHTRTREDECSYALAGEVLFQIGISITTRAGRSGRARWGQNRAWLLGSRYEQELPLRFRLQGLAMGLRPRTPVTKSTRPVPAEMRADRRARREAKDAELDRQDREAAERLANLTPHRARGAEPVMAGPGDEMAAGAGGRDHLRASHADREQVIGTLKAAFVQGMLAKDEFDLRVGQTLTSRTYAELAARTADLPAGLAAAQPPQPARAPGERRVLRPGRVLTAATVLYAGMFPLTSLMPGNSEGDPPGIWTELVVIATIAYLIVLALTGLQMFEARQQKRSGGRPPRRPPPGAGGQVSRRPPPADPGRQLPLEFSIACGRLSGCGGGAALLFPAGPGR